MAHKTVIAEWFIRDEFEMFYLEKQKYSKY